MEVMFSRCKPRRKNLGTQTAQLASRFDLPSLGTARCWPLFTGLLLALAGSGLLGQPRQTALDGAPPSKVPATRVDNVTETIHGVEVADPYRWLEDQDAPETRAWIDAQNAYTESLLQTIPRREALRERIAALLHTDTVSTPIPRGDRYFYSKRLASQDQASLYVRRGLQGPDEVLIDPSALSADHTVNVGFQSVALDGKRLAYFVRKGGADEVTPHLFDVDARKDLPDTLPLARYFGIELLPDGSGLYYTRQTAEGPRTYFHKAGSDSASDTEIFGKGYGPEKIIAALLSDDGHYLAIIVLYGAAADKTELYLLDRNKADARPLPVVKDIPARFIPEFAGKELFLETNWKAPNQRVLALDLENPALEKAREVIPEGKAVLSGISAAGGRVVALYAENASSRLRLFHSDGKLLREIRLPALGTVRAVSGRWDSPEAFFAFDSYALPPTVYRYELATGEQQVWARQQVPIDSEKFELKQVSYTSKDGTKVPMFIAYAKGTKLDGSNPTLLTGYGGFNLNNTPGYGPLAATWLLGGGVYAVANLRGGGEFGEEWHRAGMLQKKQNVFDDFLAAAQYLIAERYTSPAKLAISGGSNGGLLVGAAMTQKPEMFAAVLCLFPLLDMVRYHKFLVARYWVPEYGSSEDASQFKYIYAYSPYHHVVAGTPYPAVLFVSGDSDTRVAPLHARKMAARLQAATSSGKPVLLKYDTKAGHSGGTPVSKQIEDLTDELGFLFWRLGVTVH